MGALFGALAVWGLIVGDGGSIAGVLPVNTADNVLHLLLGLTGLVAAVTTSRPS
jgi:hypothetical protein